MELGLAVAAMGAAAVRAGSVIAPRGLERLLVAAPVGVCAACLQVLALGLIGLGASAHALTLAALLTWALTATRLPAPAIGLAREALDFWRGLSTAERVALGAVGGLSAVFTVWTARYPFLGIDAVAYRLATVIDWMQTGNPGAAFDASTAYATGSYPLGNELIIYWPMAIARSFVPAILITPAALLLFAGAGWYGLRRLGVPKVVSALAIASIWVLPVQARFLNTPSSDAVALAWSAVAAALSAGAARRPALLAPALLSAALAVGCKTTVVVPVGLALLAGGWSARRSLRPVRGLIAAAAIAGGVVGGLWYVRNLIVHGSPLYPFRSTPWGDPSPPLLKALNHSLLERPRATLRGNLDLYEHILGGALVLLAGAAVAPLMARRRNVLLASVAAGLAVLAYAAAPVTGIGDAGLPGFPISSTRYLMPALAACAVALCLASRGGTAQRRAVLALLAASVAWSVWRDTDLPFPALPSPTTLLLGVVTGALVACVAGRLPLKLRLPPIERRVVALGGPVAISLALGALLTPAGEGLVRRNVRLAGAPSVVMARFFAGPQAPPESAPVSFSPTPDARVAGDRLRRRVRLLPTDLPCRAYRRQGWVVLSISAAALDRYSPLRLPGGPLERCYYSDPPLVADPGRTLVYAPGQPFTTFEVPFP